MSIKTICVSNEFFDALLRCPYKSYLIVRGNVGKTTEYSALSRTLEDDYRAAAQQTLLIRAKQTTNEGRQIRQLSDLRHGHDVVLNLSVSHDRLSSQVDAVIKADGRSELGEFHYGPLLCCRHIHIAKNQKYALAYRALVLGKVQGRMPEYGHVIYGPKFSKSRFRLASHRLCSRQRFRNDHAWCLLRKARNKQRLDGDPRLGHLHHG